MSESASKPGCRAFAIVNAANCNGEAHAADCVASWLSARGINVLLMDFDGHVSHRGQAVRSIEEVLPHLGRLEAESLRGYLASERAQNGMVSIAPGSLHTEALAAFARAYDLIIFCFDASLFSSESGRASALQLNAVAGTPALIVTSTSASGKITLAGQAIEAMLASADSLRPAAFAIAPYDATIAARLARRWRIASWGDASDQGRIAERILDRAVAIKCDPCAQTNEQNPESEIKVAREVLGMIRKDRDLCDKGLREQVTAEARRIAGTLSPEQLDGASQDAVVARVIDDALGCGPLSPLLADPEVTEVMTCGAKSIYVERRGRIERTEQGFADDAHLMAVIERMLLSTGRRLDEASPAVDARLPDGSRLHAIIPPLAIDGPVLTIRRFLKSIEGMAQAVSMRMIPAEIAEFLCSCVRARISIVISGGTGAGKTTLLGALASEIDARERIITIEDAAELRIRLPHVVRLEARPPNIEGAGAVTIRDLVRNALRMRPDRIVVGECRGPEALDMLQAMNTGHEGSLTTVHANSPRDAIARLETMVLMAGTELPLVAIREQIARAIDLIVQVARVRGGERKVVEIAEVTGMEGHVVSMQTLADNSSGELRTTGLPPQFAERLCY